MIKFVHGPILEDDLTTLPAIIISSAPLPDKGVRPNRADFEGENKSVEGVRRGVPPCFEPTVT
jgi:hypothetical protein